MLGARSPIPSSEVVVPKLIAVESESDAPGFADPRFATFDSERDLGTARNETVQIGYRLAAAADVERVVGVDVSEGEISFFPFGAVQEFAQRSGRSSEIQDLVASFEAKAKDFDERQLVSTISELLLGVNEPAALERDHQKFYYGMFGFSDDQEQPGAALHNGWYARNAILFSRLMSVARPGDRIVMVYGAGHAYWLRHFVKETAGLELVELSEYVGR